MRKPRNDGAPSPPSVSRYQFFEAHPSVTFFRPHTEPPKLQLTRDALVINIPSYIDVRYGARLCCSRPVASIRTRSRHCCLCTRRYTAVIVREAHVDMLIFPPSHYVFVTCKPAMLQILQFLVRNGCFQVRQLFFFPPHVATPTSAYTYS